MPGDIIILHMCTINDNHIMYGSWDMDCDRQTFLSFWTIFCPFTPLKTWKIKILKKWKKIPGDIIISHMCTLNNNYMMYGFWDMECNGQYFLSFWTVFCPFTPLTVRRTTILKKWKKHLETSSFYTSVPKIMIRWCTVPEIWRVKEVQTVRWTNGQKKWHIEVGAPPKNRGLLFFGFLMASIHPYEVATGFNCNLHITYEVWSLILPMRYLC